MGRKGGAVGVTGRAPARPGVFPQVSRGDPTLLSPLPALAGSVHLTERRPATHAAAPHPHGPCRHGRFRVRGGPAVSRSAAAPAAPMAPG
ncbi:hypothetical protein GCM10010342_53890 [Streptomyces anulatus]|nr:hypothetical protein GCM10010342_53890 [Streptomyces anulatus]